MIDLHSLGRELRARRRAIRLPSAELARRIGVSPTYIWLIEQAKPRSHGEPSRPSEDVLLSWMAALGMTEHENQRIRELAGYFGPPPPPSLLSTAPRHSSSSGRGQSSDDTGEHPVGQVDSVLTTPPGGDLGMRQAPPGESFGQAASPEREDELIRQLQRVLRTAEVSDRLEEATSLTRSFLRWLHFHLQDEDDLQSGR